MKSVYIIFLFAFLSMCASIPQAIGQGSRFTQEEINLQKMLIEASKEKFLRNYEAAAELYEQIVKENRSYATPHFELARIYDQLEKKELAQKHIQAAIRLDSGNEWYQTFQAELYDKEGLNLKAAAIYQQLALAHENNDLYYFQWAYYLVKAEQGEQAIEVFNKLETKAGVSEELAKRKHKIWQQMGKKKAAAEEYEKLVAKYPTNIDYRHFLARYYLQVGEKKKAKQHYEMIIEQYPQDAKANLALASFESKGKKGSDEAYLQTLQELFLQADVLVDVKIAKLYPYITTVKKASPATQEQVLNLGQALIKTHEDNAKAHAIYGDLLYQLDKVDEALEQYQITLKLDDTVFPVWENTMQLLYTKKDFDQLVSLSEEAIDLFPNQGVAFYFNGLANKEKGVYNEAMASLELVLIMSSHNPLLLKQTYTAIGEIYQKLDKLDLAEDAFKRAKAITPAPKG